MGVPVFKKLKLPTGQSVVVCSVVRRRGGSIDRMRREERQRREVDDEGHRRAAPEAGPQHPGFPGGPSDTSILTRYQDHVSRHLWFRDERRSKTNLKGSAHGSKLIGWIPHILPRAMSDWLVASGLSSLQHTSLARVDTHLLSTFVER
ncbi:uncharacterized protein LOC131645860 [Vicia villosa]|uniref:uncharacterized protein LOC131645860 n=1 Tax=Vicia villosa TaxID=3911 RepID=UPI00273CEAEC|nr:uncharacterized protein LOC131645860 [Vicia villosa]